MNHFRLDDNCPIRYDDGRNPYLEIEDFQFYYASCSLFYPNFNTFLLIIFISKFIIINNLF